MLPEVWKMEGLLTEIGGTTGSETQSENRAEYTYNSVQQSGATSLRTLDKLHDDVRVPIDFLGIENSLDVECLQHPC